MNLLTQIPLNPKEPQIDYDSNVLLLGSCFTENIGGKLDYFKLQNAQNPFGIIFNPVSIENLVFRALHEEDFSEKDVFQHNGLWHCFEVHSTLSGLNKDEVLSNLNLQLKVFRKQLTESSHIIVTLGSAWVYHHLDSDSIVANCHKVPQKAFTKELLLAEIISKSLQNCISEIKEVNPKVTFIFTVSPVRHIKDGFEENALSKAHLLTGIHNAIELSLGVSHTENACPERSRRVEVQSKGLHYFPSYELMMDELRDYRFYKRDMLHPNETAIQYMWERFRRVWISSKTEDTQKEVEQIQKGLRHRPFNPNSEEHKVFQKSLHNRIQKLQKELPWIQF